MILISSTELKIAYLCSRGSAVGIAHFINTGYIDKIIMGKHYVSQNVPINAIVEWCL